ncbi:peptidyl-prolyl cis-trans isomerase [Candidatus Babeliales bacterium]|nr:peptidyl-prolyl cis-trans isomerase [Candidatus Babeliales bacterium]
MKKFFLLVLLSLSYLSSRDLVDKIIARVNGINVLLSHLNQPRINSQPYTLEEAVAQELYFQQASRYKLVPSTLEVEKYIASYKAGNNLKHLNDEDFESHLKKNEGFASLDQFKREYARYISVNTLIQQEIKQRIFITAQEVESYYKKYPEWVEASYKLKTAIIPFDKAKTEAEVKKIKDIDWIEHDEWLEKDSISENMTFIFKMKKNEISKPVKTQYGYQLVQLIDKKPKRKKILDESYIEIEKRLRASKMDKFEKEYRDELKSKSTIVYL